MGKTVINMDNWNRTEYYNFFGNMDNPFWALTARVDFTTCYQAAKENHLSFFLCYVHKILTALNSVKELRYRLENGQVVLYDTIGVSSTIGRPDGSFGYSYIEYYADLNTFINAAEKEVARVKAGTGLMLNSREQRLDTCYFTAIPWVDFTHITHVGGNKPGDSVPKIAVGKMVEENGRLYMSVEIEVNHALADGRHLGQFFQALEQN